jgi:hypothetical protein
MNTKTAEERAAERFDREASYIELHRGEGYATCIREEVEPLEEELEQKNAENVRLRALGAELANSINILIGVRRDVESLLTLNEKTALAAVAAWTATELGFVPTNTPSE